MMLYPKETELPEYNTFKRLKLFEGNKETWLEGTIGK